MPAGDFLAALLCGHKLHQYATITLSTFRRRLVVQAGWGVTAAPYAISMAQENQARLLLLHVMRDPELKASTKTPQDSVANVMHQLYELVPPEAELWCRPEAAVRFGIPAVRILEAAAELEADLIVLGVRDAAGHLGAATHLERTTAHKVVAHAGCPVLTVRG